MAPDRQKNQEQGDQTSQTKVSCVEFLKVSSQVKVEDEEIR